MPIWPPVMAGKNDNNKLHQDNLSCKGNGCLGGCIAIFHVCFGGHCACASPGEILYILSKLTTMSVLGSWHVYCLGWVIWWLDRNRQDLLTECTFMSLNKCVFMQIKLIMHCKLVCLCGISDRGSCLG